jgi:OmpA-OmpF porin, OOP family
MKHLRHALALAALVVLSACSMVDSYNEVDRLNKAEFVGSPFTQALATEYRAFANSELDKMFDFPDALHFARKGLAAAAGEVVPPEPLENWNLRPEHLEALAPARGRLVTALDRGGRDTVPQVAARAQVAFDCWVEQAEERWQTDDIASCRGAFERHLAEMEAAIAPPPVIESPMIVEAPMAPQDAMFLVFFNWNSAKLDDGGLSVVDAVAQEIAGSTPPRVSVLGHADTSGPRAYNQRLGLRRAGAVRDALVARGVDKRLIHTESRGQDDLLVPTADEVREPANRRASIAFQ